MKTYPIFLASSNELDTERVKFGNFIRWVSDSYKNKNVEFKLEVWEDMDSAFNKKSKQGDYNDRLKEAEIVIVFFWTKMGKWTLKEFELAYQLYNNSETDRPLVYVYEKLTSSDDWKPTKEDIESKAKFKKRLLTEEKEQFHCTFNDFKALEHHFLKTLHGLFANNVLTYGERAKMLSPNGPVVPNPFLGREKELKTLDERFEKSPQTLLIHAEGGMGKTTLASKYWYDSEYRYSHQAWLFCDQGIMDALKTLVPKLGLVPRAFNSLEEADQIVALKTAISNMEGDFLLVLDNANDEGHIMEFLQQFRGFKWNVLITSRSREVLDFKDNEMHLEHLSPVEAKALFLEYYREASEDFDQLLDRFLEGLNYHTLLIEVFAKNLKEASELRMNLKGFIEELDAKGLILDENNNFDIRSSWTGNVKKKAATTNDILEILYDFTKLSEEDRLFLVNMSLLPSENYTMQFLLELFEPEKIRTFGDALKDLYRKGWIGGVDGGDKPLYRLSPVIQSLVHAKNRNTLWEDGQALFLRLKELLKYEQENDNTHSKFKWVPFGKYFAELFKENDGEEFNLFLNHLALILKDLGGERNLQEAKSHLEKALSSYIRNFGEDSPSVATSRSNLALVLKGLGGEANLLEARGHLEKALSSDIRNFGEDSPSVARSRSNMATVLQDLGGEAYLLEARGHLEKALSSGIRNFGEDSPSVATSRSNLALVFRGLGGEANLLEARGHLEKALTSDIRNFGEDSPSVATSRSNLALVLKDLGGEAYLLEARGHLEKALSSYIRNFGEDSPSVATSRSNLATVFSDLGGEANLLEARGHLEKALASDIRNFGEDSHSVARSRFNLAFVFRDLGGEANLLETKGYLEKALSSDIRNFGEDSPNTALRMFNLGGVLAEIGNPENLREATDLLEAAKYTYLKHFGEDFHIVQNIQSWIEFVYERLDEMENE